VGRGTSTGVLGVMESSYMRLGGAQHLGRVAIQFAVPECVYRGIQHSAYHVNLDYSLKQAFL
jgi:hypothetical protein